MNSEEKNNEKEEKVEEKKKIIKRKKINIVNDENIDNKKSSIENELSFKEVLPYIIVIIAIIVIKVWIVTPIKVKGSSMDDTLANNDIMLLDKITYKITGLERFDIVVVKYDGNYIIKRLIGFPGEKVAYKNQKLYINDKYVKEDYDHGETEDFEVILPKDKYFVLGDNREVSVDSRKAGPFKLSDIKGRTKLILFPFNRIGIR